MNNAPQIPKRDTSKAHVFSMKEKLSKIDRYGWNKDIGKQGEYVLIPKMDLSISGSYQRHGDGSVDVDAILNGTDERKNAIKLIAKTFRWELFGVLIVVMWKDGSMWVVDGGHRVIAAWSRDDINLLPAIVFERPDISMEELIKMDAQLFFDSCKLRRSMTSYDKHRAASTAEHDSSVFASSILDRHGVSLVKSAHNKTQFSAISTLTALIEKDKQLAEDAFAIALTSAVDGPVTNEILRGVFYLMDKSNFGKEHKSVLATIGDRAINHAIKQAKIIQNKGGEKVYAQGIADAINSAKKRNVSRVVIG